MMASARKSWRVVCGMIAIVILQGTPGAVAQPRPAASFAQGQADRQRWENWFAAQVGDFRLGAYFWSGQRSLPYPGSCRAVPPSFSVEGTAGCFAAQRMLAPFDQQRNADPTYRLGWNNPEVDPAALGVTVGAQESPSAPVVVPPPVAAPASREANPAFAQWVGSGMMATRPFHVDGSWEIQWTAGAGFFAINLIKVGGGDELVANQTEPGSSSSYVPEGGDYYLKIKARSPWTIRAVSVAASVPSAAPEHTAPTARPFSAPAVSAPVTPPAPRESLSAMPLAESALLEIVKASIAQYRSGQNEMQKGAARPSRAQAICSILGSMRAENWIGTVSTLSTNGDGKGILSIAVAPNISIETSNNAFSDAFDHTLIEPASALFKTASMLRKGQKVRFGGLFLASKVDCIEERSLTLDGSIMEPAFMFKFTSIEGIE